MRVATVFLAFLASLSLFAQDKMTMTDERDTALEGVDSYQRIDYLGNEVITVIDGLNTHQNYDPIDDPDSPYFRGWEVDESEQVNKMGYYYWTIDLEVWADSIIRNRYSPWSSWTELIVETADNAYWRDYKWNVQIVRYFDWYVNSVPSINTAQKMLDDLEQLSANYGSGRGLATGFTGDYARFVKNGITVGGIANVYTSNPSGQGIAIVCDQGTTDTVYALRHEWGHNLGCYHDTGSAVCMMNYAYAYVVDYFDSTHAQTVRNHRNWFKAVKQYQN